MKAWLFFVFRWGAAALSETVTVPRWMLWLMWANLAALWLHLLGVV